MRPAASNWLARWAETALAGGAAAACLWTGTRAALDGAMLGWPLLALGAAAGMWAWAALGRARLGAAAEGPGVVQVDERRVAYFGTEGGGIAALDDLLAVDVLREPDGGAWWRLHLTQGGALDIPAGAAGAARLPEALAALPGFSMDRAAAAFHVPRPGRSAVWRREAGVVVTAFPRLP